MLESNFPTNLQTNNIAEIDETISNFTIIIKTVVMSSVFQMKKPANRNSLPAEILIKIQDKNLHRRECKGLAIQP